MLLLKHIRFSNMARYTFSSLFEKNLIDTCEKSDSMAKAALALGMNYKTLCFHAKRLGCFKSNQSGKGIKKLPSKLSVSLADIFGGAYPTYQTHKIKKRLLNEGYKQHICELCGLKEWMSKPIPLELHHRNGIRHDNSLANLELLCPNCHALTDNYRAKNIKKLSARTETFVVEPLKFGETLSNRLAIPSQAHQANIGVEGVET